MVPLHIILTKKQTREMLDEYMVDLWQLPRISDQEPVVIAVGAQRGDVLKIVRDSKTTVETVEMYRLVVKNKK